MTQRKSLSPSSVTALADDLETELKTPPLAVQPFNSAQADDFEEQFDDDDFDDEFDEDFEEVASPFEQDREDNDLHGDNVPEVDLPDVDEDGDLPDLPPDDE